MICHQFSSIVILNVHRLPNSKCECFMWVWVHTLSQLRCDHKLLRFHSMLLLLLIWLERSHRGNYIFNDSSDPQKTISVSLNLNNFVFQTELYCTQYIYTLSEVTTQRWDPQLAIRVIYSWQGKKIPCKLSQCNKNRVLQAIRHSLVNLPII